MRKAPTALICIALVLFSANVSAVLEAPNVSSSNYPNPEEWYMPVETIRLSWGAIEGATKYYYSMDKDPNTEPSLESDSTIETTAEYRKIGGVWYFHVRAAKGNNLGNTAHFKVRLDNTRPDWSISSPLEAKPLQDGNIEISWAEATDDDSGVDHYALYRGAKFDFDLRSASRKYSPLIGTSHIDTNNMTQNNTFFYLVVAIDKAGNQSRVSNKASATTYAFCDINYSVNVRLSDDEQSLLISINADENLYAGTLVAELPDGETVEFFKGQAIVDYNTALDLNGVPEGVISIDFTARERLGDDCSWSEDFIYDVTLPSAQIISPELNETVGGVLTVKAEAFDNGSYKSGIDSVEFIVRTEAWESVGMMDLDSNNVYAIDWNTFNFDNGRHQIKVVAKDTVGNSAEGSSGAIVFNTLYQQGDADAAISAAEASRERALEFVDSLRKQNVRSESVNALLASADGNLSKASELYDVGGNEYTNSRSFARKAEALYDSVEGQLTTEKTHEQQFIYNKEQAGILLNASPIDKSLVPQAEQLINDASPQRRLELIKVVDSNNTYYRANIIVNFSLPATYLAENDLNFLRLLEFVPKEFTSSSDDIYSYYGFTVVERDPVIEFQIDEGLFAAGEISYGLDRDLTEEEANALIEGETVNKYLVPPVLLHVGTTPGFPGLPIPSIPGLKISPELIIGTVVVVVVVAAALAIFLIYRKRKKTSKPDLNIFE